MITLVAGWFSTDPDWTLCTLRLSASLICLLGGILLLAMAAYVMGRTPSQIK
jgi:hypothetical protein